MDKDGFLLVDCQLSRGTKYYVAVQANIIQKRRKESFMNWRTEEYGGLSNMAGSYPLRVSGIRVFSSEALYQACRFPHQPEWQREIISQQNPMAAKMKSKKEGRRKHHSRSDLEPALRVLGRDRHQKVELQEKAARAFQRTFQYVLRS